MTDSWLKIFSGNSNRALAQEICRCVGVPLGDATVTSFPDGETFVKINENIRGRDVYIVQSTCPPTNHHLMELLIMIDAARRASAQRITAVLPFFGYARQDRKDQPRVPITAKLVANLLVSAGATRVLAMDLHSQQIQGFFDIPVDHLYASPVFLEYLASSRKESLVVCSPDVGGIKMAAAYAGVLGASLALVAKKRQSATQVEAIDVEATPAMIEKISAAMNGDEAHQPSTALTLVQPSPSADSIGISAKTEVVEPLPRYASQPAE